MAECFLSSLDRDVASQPVVPFLEVLERHGVGRLSAEHMDVDEVGRRR